MKKLLSLIILLSLVSCNNKKLNPDVVNVYTKRHYQVDKDLFEQFEKIHNIKVNVVKASADELIERINSRASEMIDRGAISEVKKFIKLKVPKNKTASKAIGVSEIKEFLNKKIQISELIDKISIKTRQYAKRQVTWSRGHMSDWNKIKSNNLNQFLKKI